MREALFLSGLPADLKYSIACNDSKPYDVRALENAADSLDSLPDCFAREYNDVLALNLL